MIEITLKFFCDGIKAECANRNIPLDFISCAWHSYRSPDSVVVTLHMIAGSVQTFTGASFAATMQSCRDAVCAMAPTKDQLAEILGVQS